MSQKPRPQFSKADRDAVVDLLEELPRIHVSHDGGYSFADRAHDFMAVFNGTSTADQGRRVLAQIAQICDPVSSIKDADSHGSLAWKGGMRRVMHELMLCMVTREPVRVERKEPNARPADSDSGTSADSSTGT